MFTRAGAFAQQHPWKLSLGLSTVKSISADLFAQKVVEQKEKLNTERTILWGSFGFVYGGFCHSIYQILFPKLFPVASVVNVLKMNAFDNFVNTPFIFFPCFYVLKEKILLRGSYEQAWKKYKSELLQGCIATWCIFIPAHLVTFGLIPPYLRISFATAVSFVFTIVISVQQNEFDENREGT
jgi:hypothetical protein